MKIINTLKTHLREQYNFVEQDIIIFTYVIEKIFLFWRYYTIKQVMPDMRKPIYDHEKPVKIKIRLTAQRDFQQMWEWLNEYKNINKK